MSVVKLIQNAYTAIESHKYKKALSILESPELARSPMSKSLKGIVCITMNNTERAREAILELLPLYPTDEIVLKQAMDVIHYIGDYSLAVTMYENAYHRDKNNITTGEMYYFSLFCVGDFDRMRSLSIELVSLYKMKKYSMWNVSNIILNDTLDSDPKKAMLLKLSEAMVRNTLKSIDVTSREGRGCQWLLIQILLKEAKFEEVESIIEERMRDYIVSQKLLDERMLQRGVLRSLQQEERIIGMLEEDIMKGWKCDWDTIAYYTCCVTELMPYEEAIMHLEQFGKQLDAMYKEKMTREVHLYAIEVAYLKAQHDRACMELTERILRYVRFIGHKACCYSDLERWLPWLYQQKEENCMKRMEELVITTLNLTICIEKGKDLLNNVQMKVTALQIAIALRIKINTIFLKELYNIYNAMIPAYSETLESKEILSLDAVPLLVAEMLHINAIEQDGLRGFFNECEAIAILEENIHRRPHFFRSSLALCLQYYYLSVPALAAKNYNDLDVKEIHTLSMSYPLEYIVKEWSGFKDSRDFNKRLQRFIHDGQKETYVKEFQCIQENSFVSIPTMIHLRDRLKASREPLAFMVYSFLNCLSVYIRDNEAMNNMCFNDLFLYTDIRLRDNADYKYTEFWNVPNTQLDIAKTAGIANEILQYYKSVAELLLVAKENEWKLEKVESASITKILTSFDALKTHEVKSGNWEIVLLGCELFNMAVNESRKEHMDKELCVAEIRKKLGRIETVLSTELSMSGIVNPRLLASVSQLAKHTVTWCYLLLGKNKKVNKPSPAKEPASVLMVEVIGGLIQTITFLIPFDKSTYYSILEKADLATPLFHPHVKTYVDSVCEQHSEAIRDLLKYCEEISSGLKQKNYKVKSE